MEIHKNGFPQAWLRISNLPFKRASWPNGRVSCLRIHLVQARIDGTIKEEAAAVLEAMGLTISDAVRLLLTKVAREQALRRWFPTR